MFQTKVIFADWQTPEQRKVHAAHWRKRDAGQRKINDALEFWRGCAKPACRRGRTCASDMHACFARNWALVPDEAKEWLRGALLAMKQGARGDELVRAAEARRAKYLASLETTNAAETSPAPPATETPAAATEVRVRRL
jgi:hypothetical protein